MTDAADVYELWWKFYQADGRAKFSDLISGSRSTPPTSGVDTFPGGKTEKISKAHRQTGSCQYWVKGLSAPCRYWKGKSSKCTFEFKPPEESPPSGYGLGGCDQLGRRSWCDKYEGMSEINLNQFVCIAPCMEKSGLGKQIIGENSVLLYRPLKIEEIKGYNSDESEAEVGQCDGWGMGRGKPGMDLELLELIYDVLPICRHYKPFQMGFGALQPRPFHGSDKPGVPFNSKINYIPTNSAQLHDGSAADPLEQMGVLLPFSFQIYNARAMYQKCSNWENSAPEFFKIDYVGADPSMYNIIMGGGISYCKCKDSSCEPYKTVVDDWPEGVPWILLEVWAKYKGIVCNGAKPECPCYTGKWIYCIDTNMRDGMRVTADQIFELRFWASDWASQAEYDAFYLSKPGTTKGDTSDISTADIFTFTYWEKLDPSDPNTSKMKGKKHHMCMPAPLNMREFDVKTYIIKSEANYPLLGEDFGTVTEDNSATFPTLIRELQDPTSFVPDIFVVYPYSTVDPWAVLACNETDKPDYCYHDSNLMEDPLISVIGSTVLKKPIYVINETLSSVGMSKSSKHINTYIRASQIPKKMLRTVCEDIEDDIKFLTEEGLAVFNTMSDHYGFFEASRVKLKLNVENVIYIICNWTTGDYKEYSFRKVKVRSRYWAGYIEQGSTILKHEGEVWFTFFPLFFYPSFSKISGRVNITQSKGEVQSVFSTYALYVYSVMRDIAFYSYCINQYSETIGDVTKWVQVGATGYIWAEIDNVEISYLWNFAVTKASIHYKGSKTPDVPTFFCGTQVDDIILEIIYPENTLFQGITVDRNREIIRRALPPNAILLRSSKPMPFFNKDWRLSVSYSYQRLDTFMSDTIVWPNGIGVEGAYNVWADSPFRINHLKTSDSFTIEEVGGLTTRGSVKVMAYIADEKKRVQAAASTKFLLQGYVGGGRSVDIDYKYSVDATAYVLEPDGGFFTWRGSPKVTQSPEPAVHGARALCGDHECDASNCIGPMWFPFNRCTTVAYYDEVNSAANCVMPISEAVPNLAVMGFSGWRYVVAPEYLAWIRPGGNWAASCGSPWSYHYSKAGAAQRFVGTARKRAKIDKWYYIFMGWALPPFGNLGRETVERYITRDFISHIDLIQLRTHFCYVPMVFDKEDLFADLNPFANPDEATPLHEPFSHFSMMSNYTAGFIGEQISENRYRFEDIIKPIYHGNCMYPYPLMGSVGGWRTIRYGFKNASHVWAWPEFWKPIERNRLKETGKCIFIELSRPEYIFDYNKVEHRLITDEGPHFVTFKPPKFDDNGKMINYPSVAIDGKFPRYFKLLYGTDYSPENVDWADESSEGKVGGSDGKNIYELANNRTDLNGWFVHEEYPIQWFHDFNTLFDNSSSSEPNDERKIFAGKNWFGEDVWLYFNRGLIAFLPRNRLQYLPIDISLTISPQMMNGKYDDKELNSLICYWDLKKVREDSGTKENIGSPITIIINGEWGIKKNEDEEYGEEKESTITYSMPGIEVNEGSLSTIKLNEDGFPIWPEGAILLDSIGPKAGKDFVLGKYDTYKLQFELSRNPERIVGGIEYFMIRVFSAPGGELLKINSIELEFGNYVTRTEHINTSERKYYAGVMTATDINADGPNTDLYRTYERSSWNSGQFFPFDDKFTIVDHKDGTFLDEGKTDFEEGGKVVSKVTMVGFTKIYREDEKLGVTMDNLKSIELNPQKELYEQSMDQDDYDELNFEGMRHPAVEEWLKTLNIRLKIPNSMILGNKKIDWDRNNLKNMLTQDGDFIAPGGHFWNWSDKFTRQRCYLFGGIQDVYAAKYTHYKHGRGGKGFEEDALPTGAAFNGWGRLDYYNSKMAMLKSLGQSELGDFTDVLTGAKNYVDKRSG